jgi:hypothetical protein
LDDLRHAHSEADVVRACVDAVRAARDHRRSTLAHTAAAGRMIRSSAVPMYSYGFWETTGSCFERVREAGAARIARPGTT